MVSSILKTQLLYKIVMILDIMRSLISSSYGLTSSGVCFGTSSCKLPSPFFHRHISSSARLKEFTYQVVIDAGSTGSRVHIFTFRRTLAGLKLENADFEEIEPGLSFYLNKPEETFTYSSLTLREFDGWRKNIHLRPNLLQGAYSVNSLLHHALNIVPKCEWESTPVSLRATAGLRLLPEVVAGKIIKQVQDLLVSSPFETLKSDFISIMDGDDEGIFAWTTLNFLTDNLNKDTPKSLGALDLGGGSTQIVFRPASEDTVLSSPESHLSSVKILGSQYKLYSYSYLGLGLMSARQTVFELTNRGEKFFNVIGNVYNVSASPCMLPSYQGVWSFSGKEIMIEGNKSFSYDKCLHYVKQIVYGVHQPAEIVNRAFYAFSYYYETALGLGLIAPNVGGTLSLGNYVTAAKKVCSDEGKEMLLASPFLCLDAVYVTTLLRSGYGFEESQIFKITRRINNVELSWALGAALHMLQEW